jgi:hypothetical protein
VLVEPAVEAVEVVLVVEVALVPARTLAEANEPAA